MSRSSQQMFSNASNLGIHGGQFSNVQGDMHLHSAGAERYGLKLLLQNIAPGALHDAAERGDQPGCHENTRVAILKEIMDWIQDPGAREKFLFWLYGPAGSGKTSIAQSIAEALAKKGLLAASFFFWRSVERRNTSAYFITTIAYQLSQFIPSFTDPLFAAIEKDPIIFSRSLSTQLQVLIIDPIKFISSFIDPKLMVIIIDGLDECGPNGNAPAEILDLLKMAINEFKHIPLLILVSSRPEYEIRSSFFDYNQRALGALTKTLGLDDRYKPDRDIKFYLFSKLRNIRDEHSKLGTKLPSLWPYENDINRVVEKASGQFIFAATAVKFIESLENDPVERLNIIIGLSTPGTERPFALLDELYRTILSSVADWSKVLDISALLLLKHPEDYPPMTLPVIESILGLNVRKTLIGMHALVYVPPQGQHPNHSFPHFYHASFGDFLLDKSRSREFHLDPAYGHLRLSQCWLNALQNYKPSHIGGTTSIPFQYLTLIGKDIYDPLCWFLHHSRLSPEKSLGDSLACFNIKSAVKQTKYSERNLFSHWEHFFNCAKEQGGDRVDVFPRLWHEFCAHFLDDFPKQLHSFIPAILSFGEHARDIALLLVSKCYPNHSEEVYRPLHWLGIEKIRNTIADIVGYEVGNYIDYTVLAKQVIKTIFAIPTDGYNYPSAGSELWSIQDCHFTWFNDLLCQIPPDISFAKFLCHYVPRYTCIHPRVMYDVWAGTMPVEGQLNIVRASMRYIQACGILIPQHSHYCDIDRCLICYGEKYGPILNLEYPSDIQVVIKEQFATFIPISTPRSSTTHQSCQDIATVFGEGACISKNRQDICTFDNRTPIKESNISYFCAQKKPLVRKKKTILFRGPFAPKYLSVFLPNGHWLYGHQIALSLYRQQFAVDPRLYYGQPTVVLFSEDLSPSDVKASVVSCQITLNGAAVIKHWFPIPTSVSFILAQKKSQLTLDTVIRPYWMTVELVETKTTAGEWGLIGQRLCYLWPICAPMHKRALTPRGHWLCFLHDCQ